ncbi:type IV toxin-antitoxin system AbiEi family antitoxin domain-containing protein [Patescibacteria group bacterium]|nr:type IV toxin-antitoxin system AbiEi family antitoxin domain-containing protein [Patescibacteria group bacterium]
MKYQDFYKTIKKPYFSRLDISMMGLTVYNYQISLWAKKGYIERIKRGLYIFSERRNELSPEEMSFLIYDPSYISLEFALSHYGFIPEMVYAITAISTKTTRKFANKFGKFIYRSVKSSLFFGYFVMETKNGKYLMAEPEKAILDYIYLNLSHINSKEDIEEMRINREMIKKTVNRKKLEFYAEKFESEKMRKIIKNILN